MPCILISKLYPHVLLIKLQVDFRKDSPHKSGHLAACVLKCRRSKRGKTVETGGERMKGREYPIPYRDRLPLMTLARTGQNVCDSSSRTHEGTHVWDISQRNLRPSHHTKCDEDTTKWRRGRGGENIKDRRVAWFVHVSC